MSDRRKRARTPGARKRRVQLIDPRLQLQLCGVFFVVATICIFVLFSLFQIELSGSALRSGRGSADLVAEIQRGLWRDLALALGILGPVTFTVGIWATFRVAGPLHRLRCHLRSLAAGEDPGPLGFRVGDELQDLPDLLNAAVARVRADAARAPEVRATTPRLESEERRIHG